MIMNEIKIKYILDKLSVGDWVDLRTSYDIHLDRGEYYNIPLGIAMQLPKGYEAIVAPRSSTFKNMVY